MLPQRSEDGSERLARLGVDRGTTGRIGNGGGLRTHDLLPADHQRAPAKTAELPSAVPVSCVHCQ